MLDFHNPLVVAPLLLFLVFFEDPFKLGVLLAVVISICDAYVEIGVLASPPEPSGPNVKVGVVVVVGRHTVIVLVVNFLELRFSLDVCTYGLQE